MANARKPLDTAFKQQRLPAWQPLLTPRCIILTFVITGVVFIVVGCVVLSVDSKVVEITLDYPADCALGSVCQLTTTIPSDMVPPVYFYYQIDGMYQNHRRYVKSRNDNQLAGKPASSSALHTSCDPATTFAVGGTQKFVYPCGLIAASLFNDVISAKVDNVPLAGDAWNSTNIIWSTDLQKFKSSSFYETPEFTHQTLLDNKPVSLPPVTDPDFIVWMRTAGLPKFRKLYRVKMDKATMKANSVLEITVANNYDVASFGATKSIVVSTTSALGGKNPFLAWAYIIVGAICVAFGAMLAVKFLFYPRKPGDLSYWEKNHVH